MRRVLFGVAMMLATYSVVAAQVVKVEIEFAVDMTVEIATGNFDPETQLVTVSGSMNGWDTTADTLLPDFVTPSRYTKLFLIDSVNVMEPDTLYYKYVTGTTGGDAPNGYESVDNRPLIITGNEPDADNNGYLDVVQTMVPTFNNNRIEDYFASDMTITFQVDARPAYYFLADSGFVPSDVQTNETVSTWSGVYANGLLGPSHGWDSWGPDLLGSTETQKLYDDGTNGDAVAGDSIFTIVVSYMAGDARKGPLKFGLDGYDNESLFGANHQLTLPDDGQAGKTFGEATIDLIFGAMETTSGGYQDALFDPYIQVSYSDGEYSAAVVRRGGDEPENLAVDPVAGEIPEKVMLSNNYPNPFNPSTTFEYSISDPQHVLLRVFDLTGRLIQTLVDDDQLPSAYRVTFDANNLASGVYIYQLQTADRVISKKMLLVK
ncbi:MAG: T9SS type A sorting domain-containing protein [Rhodothermales bacterium]